MEKNDETNNANEHNKVKQADQLAIYKCGQEVKLEFTEKLQLSVQSRTWTCHLRIWSPVP